MWAKLQKTIGSKRQRHLVDLLVKKREAKGLTQTELAKKLRQHQSFVARLESGQRRVDIIELLDIADALEFDPAKLIADLRQR